VETSEGPYSRFGAEDLILRDYLAAHRTTLANDRTLLAYLRTTLTFLIGGASFVQFFDALVVRTLGWVFIPAAAVTLIVGIVRYEKMKRSLGEIGAGQAGSSSARAE